MCFIKFVCNNNTFVVKKIYATERGNYRIDAMLLVSPVVGTLIRRISVSQFTRTLSTMLQSGVPILDALLVVGKTSGNKVIERAVFHVRDSIAEGRPISEPLEETGVFPNMVVQMVSIGEEADRPVPWKSESDDALCPASYRFG